MSLFLKISTSTRRGGGSGVSDPSSYTFFKEVLRKLVSRRDYDIFVRETEPIPDSVPPVPSKYEVWALGKEITVYLALNTKPTTFDEDFSDVTIVGTEFYFSASETSTEGNGPSFVQPVTP